MIIRQPITFKAEVGALGIKTAEVRTDKTMAVNFRFPDDHSVEICRIEGLRLKPDASYFPEIKANGAKAAVVLNPDGTFKQLYYIKVDTGPSKKYPSTNWDI